MDAKLKQTGGAGSRVTMTSVAWRAVPGLALEEWLETGRKLGVLGRNAGWWIGDWLCYGNHTYGERYARAARLTGYDVQTLMNMVYVASHFQPERRRENLSWSHHAEVAALDPAEQDQWLDRAEADRLSVRCLRQEIRGHVRSTQAAEQRTLGQAPGATDARAADERLVCPTCGHSLDDDATAAEGSSPPPSHS